LPRKNEVEINKLLDDNKTEYYFSIYFDTNQVEGVMTGEEFGLKFSSVKLFQADTAVGQIMALFFYNTHLTTCHS